MRGGGPGAMANMLNRELAGDIGGDGAANVELDQTEISVVDVQSKPMPGETELFAGACELSD